MPEIVNQRATAGAAATRGKPPGPGSTKFRRTKREQLIEMLSAPKGAGADTISRKLGWQPHTTRAALSGLRKSGFEIQTEKPAGGKPTRYRIVAAPGADPDAA